MMGDARTVAFGAMACSGVTVLACFLVVPLIQRQLDGWTARVALQMAEFKQRTDDSWGEMMTLRRQFRDKRQAGLELDFLDELDEDIFAEFGEDFGDSATPDFPPIFDSIPASPRRSSHDSRDSRPRFSRPRAPAPQDVRRAPATRRQTRPPRLPERLSGRDAQGRRRIASPQESIDNVIAEAPIRSEIGGVTQPQGVQESGYTAAPKRDASDAGYPDAEPSSDAADSYAPAPKEDPPAPAYEQPSRDPAPRAYEPAPRDPPAYEPAPRDPPPRAYEPAPRGDPAPRESRRPAARNSYPSAAPRRDPNYGRRQSSQPQTPRYGAQRPQAPKKACNCKKLYCPAGPPGSAGRPGRDGRQGPSGSDGLEGLPGPDMEPVLIEPPCQSCPQGPQGAPGDAGKAGRGGPKGHSGMHGLHGRDGSQGGMGGKGPIGSGGPQGHAGYAGLPGLDLLGGKGKPGKKGTKGTVGGPGLPGASGKSFYHPGPPGQRGAGGAKGPSGINGIPGLPGPIGDRGDLGVDALYCPCPEREQRPFYQTPEGDAVDAQGYDDYVRRYQKK